MNILKDIAATKQRAQEPTPATAAAKDDSASALTTQASEEWILGLRF